MQAKRIDPDESCRTVLVIGETVVAQRVCATLSNREASAVVHLVAPDDRELRSALQAGVRAVAVLVRDDVAALRYALAVAHLEPTVPLTVTVFDRTVGEQLRLFLPHATVTSPADIAVASLAGPCLSADVVAAWRTGDRVCKTVRGSAGLRTEFARRRTLVARVREHAFSVVRIRSHDPGMRLLLAGSTGLATVLIGDWAWLAGVAGRSPAEAFEEAARVVATVGPVAEHMGSAYGVWAGIAMLSTIVFTAMATAGLVDRLFEPRLVGMFGRRRAPRSGHVVVVGMGQVGLRLCAELRAMNIPVVGVERNPEAPHLRLAYSLQIPVLLGFGADRGILERAGLPRARALAAVCSDDLDNVAVAVAAAAVAPRVPVVLRAGEQEAVVETRALLPLGVTRDVTQMAATYVVATVSSSRVERVIADTFELHLLDRTGAIRRAEVGESYECGHA